MAKKLITDIRKRYKFTVGRYVIETKLNAVSPLGWDYETQAQQLSLAKKVFKRLTNLKGDNFRIYDNIKDVVVKESKV